MNMSEYRALAQRTSNTSNASYKIENAVLGLNGEAGEVADVWKKYLFQGHELDREKMIDEAGDVLWYLAEMAEGLGITLTDIARHNIDKLKRRYPDGFDPFRSMNRTENFEAEKGPGQSG